MAKDLTALLCPKSVAIIGASRTPEKVGAIILKNIFASNFKGAIYPINPNAENINDIKCYPDLNSLPETPDLAIITLPSNLVIENLNKAGEKGIKNVVVITAGFKEMGGDGQNLEKQLIETANKYQINLIGPNCLGIINNNCPLNATFGDNVSSTGNLRFISQSGAIATALVDYFKSINLGFAELITLGNKAVLNENDILEYFQNNPLSLNEEGISKVYPIGLYLESISNGPEFLKLVSSMSKKDPIFIIKPGKSEAAAHAMQSHTGAIAGEDAVLDEVIKQAGLERCETLEDFFDLAKAFAWENAPEGNKVAVISNAGGPAVISADAATKEGLELIHFDDETKNKLLECLPRSASVINPIDVLGDALAERFTKAAEIVLQTNQVQSLVVILTPQLMTEIDKTAESLGQLSKKYQKPIFCSFIGGTKIAEGEAKLNAYKIPSFRFPERAMAAIGSMWRWKRQLTVPLNTISVQEVSFHPDIDKIKETISNAVNKNQKTLDNVDSNIIISATGISAPPTKNVSNIDEAKQFTQEFGWPVVLKLSSPGLLHKKQVGGVISNLYNEEQLQTGWDNLERKITELDESIKSNVKIQIQKEILDGVETIVGIKKDPTFGPVLLFGAGGSLAEIISDKNLKLLPINFEQAKSLVEQSKIFKVLKGHEGEPPLALDRLYELIVKLSKISEALPDVTDIEINPVIVNLNDAWAVDTKVVLKQGEHKVASAPQFKVATTLEHQILATTFHYFTFESDIPLNFQPGQYISVKVAGNRINCYSVARRDGPNRFHLLVNIAPGGPGSKFFENLKVGDKISYLGPFGTFTLKPDGAQNLLFLGTGSGLAPLICMIDQLLKEQNSPVQIHLYLGLTIPEDAFWLDEFEHMKQQYPNFHYRVVIWQPNENWHGDTGFITDWVGNDFQDASSCSAYLCGNPKMTEGVTNVLVEHGCPKIRIYSEKF